MARKTRAEALATRDRILDTAERVFEKKGVSRTTLGDIASAAGVTRGAIYGHFRNKNDLFVAMFRRTNLPIKNLYEKSARDRADPVGRLRSLLVVMLQGVATNRQDQRVLNILHHKCEFTDEFREVVARVRTVGRKEAQHLKTILRNAIGLGQLPENLDIARAQTLFYALLFGLIGNWLQSPRSFNLHRDAEAFADTYLDMLRMGGALRTHRKRK